MNINTAPIEEVYKNPIVQELLDKLSEYEGLDLEKTVKVPFVLKDKILMSPGVWNSYFYSSDSIKQAYLQTPWDKKEVRSLFLDHLDGTNGRMGSLTWIGEVNNIRISGDDLIGDLVVVDKSTAMKLAYGAKMGISPRVSGSEDNNTMTNFRFDNFSVVINPAVKTAYINNSQIIEPELADISAFEKVRKEKGISVSDFYAAPRDPPSDSSLPIFDAAHVRNAMARFNQTKFKNEEEKKSAKKKIIAAAKKFKIEIGKFEKNNEEVNKMSEEAKIELPTEQPAVVAENKVDAPTQPFNGPGSTSVSELSDDMIQVLSEIEAEMAGSLGGVMKKAKEIVSKNPDMKWADAIKQAGKEMKEELAAKPKEEVKPVEEKKPEPQMMSEEMMDKIAEMVASKMKPVEAKKEMAQEPAKDESVIKELSEKVQELEAKLNEPAKKSVKCAELSQALDPDTAFLNALKAL